MIKTLTNTTGVDIFLSDIGIVLLPSTPYTAHPLEYYLLAASTELETAINSDAITVSDGYDILKKDLAVKFIQGSVSRESSGIATTLITAMSASTLTLTAASRIRHIFTGGTSGQIVKLPDATTLNVGYQFQFWNNGSTSLVIQDGSATPTFVLVAQLRACAILQDNSTAAGVWLFEPLFIAGGGGGNGVVNFGYQGTANGGRWLEVVSNNPTNEIPFVIAGTIYIRALGVSVDTTGTFTITVYKNGSVLDTISVTSAKKNTKLNLAWQLLDKDQLSAQVTSGTASRPNLSIWI